MQSHMQCTLIMAAPNSPPPLVASATVWKLNHAFPCFLWALLVRYQPRLTHSPHPYTLTNHNSASSKIWHIVKASHESSRLLSGFKKKSRTQLSSIVFWGHFLNHQNLDRSSCLTLCFDSDLLKFSAQLSYWMLITTDFPGASSFWFDSY